MPASSTPATRRVLGAAKLEPSEYLSRQSTTVLLMVETLHDFVYQNSKYCGSIVHSINSIIIGYCGGGFKYIP